MECSICGVSDSTRRVFRAISSKGIVVVCESCASESGFPMVVEPKPQQEEARKTVYERLSIMAGIKPKSPEERSLRPRTDEREIKNIVNKNYEEKIKKQQQILHRDDLVDNFHWVIMRVRRVKGLTQKQLAERLGEPEEVIKMAENGVIPEGYGLLDKLENFLGVKLVKGRHLFIQPQPVLITPSHQIQSTMFAPNADKIEVKKVEQPEEKIIAPKRISFDKKTLDSLKIADLKRMKEEREAKEKERKESENNQNL